MAWRLDTNDILWRTSCFDHNSDFTVAGWARPVDLTNPWYGLTTTWNSSEADGGDSLSFYDTNGGHKLAIERHDGSIYSINGTQGSTAIVVDTWYHIAIVASGATGLEGFINGVSDVSDTGSRGARGTSNRFSLGCWRATPAATEGVNARMWGWKAWTRALTADQLKNEMRANVPADLNSLWGWWPALSAGDLVDYSGNGRDQVVQIGALGTEDDPPVPWGHPVLIPQAGAVAGAPDTLTISMKTVQ